MKCDHRFPLQLIEDLLPGLNNISPKNDLIGSGKRSKHENGWLLMCQRNIRYNKI